MIDFLRHYGPYINFTILVALLYWKLKEPVRKMVAERHSFIRDEVSRVEQLLANSKSRFDEFAARLKAIDAEVNSLRAQSAQEGEAMKLRIMADAKRLSGVIVADSQAGVRDVFSDARNELRLRLGLKVLDRAEQILRTRLTGDDRARIRQEFSRKVESIQ